jgi:hypothetical protein
MVGVTSEKHLELTNQPTKQASMQAIKQSNNKPINKETKHLTN